MTLKQWLLRLSIRRILFAVSLLFLALPLGSIFFLRIYESALIRQTESELIAQAAMLGAIYKQNVIHTLARHHQSVTSYGLPVQVKPHTINSPIRPVIAHLDLAKDPIYPPRPFGKMLIQLTDHVAEESSQNLQPIIEDTQKITLAGFKILSPTGQVIAGRNELGLSFAHLLEFQQAAQGNAFSLLRKRRLHHRPVALDSFSRNSQLNVFVALPVIANSRLIGVIWVNRTPSNIEEALYSKQSEISMAAILLIALTLSVSALTSHTITRPIRKLITKTKLIAEGHPEGFTPVAYPITTEISELSESLSKTASILQSRTDYIRNFAMHVSHEFKTPLTAIRGSVELLQDHLDSMPIEKQRHFLKNIMGDTEHLNRLVSRLHELAAADMGNLQETQTPVLACLESWKSFYTDKVFNIQIETDTESSNWLTSLSKESLDAILSNLLENSRQAGAKQVTLTLSLEETLKTSVVLLQDDGPGISESNQKQIFTPFFTTKRDNGGTGLGLSIVEALLSRQGGNLSLVSSTPNGTQFRIILPKV
jgi:signal transduction histidine kinase